MAEIKTTPSEASVDAFIDALENPARAADARVVLAMMERVTGEQPRMWGPSIIGFGSYRYRYDSGREGTMCRLGFSPRKGQLVLYTLVGAEGEDALLSRLGKHKTGKVCLYINKLADVEMGVLEALTADAWAWMNARYPE